MVFKVTAKSKGGPVSHPSPLNSPSVQQPPARRGVKHLKHPHMHLLQSSRGRLILSRVQARCSFKRLNIC